MNKKTLLLVFFLSGSGVATQAQAQSEGLVIYRPQFDGQVIVAGAAPVQTAPIVYTQPVIYDAPVIYRGPVVYNAPVYGAPVYEDPAADVAYYPPVINAAPAVCTPSDCQTAGYCAPCQYSTVQVIHFGRGQAAAQGYYFNAPR